MNFLVALAMGAFAVSAQAGSLVPPELDVVHADLAWIWFSHDEATGEFVKARLSVTTESRQLQVRWNARAGIGHDEHVETRVETMSFSPTAACRSLLDRSVIYITGASENGPVLERWDLGNPRVRSSETPFQPQVSSGSPPASQTRLTIPSIVRNELPIDPTLSHIASITTNPWGARVSTEDPEEVWVLEWETRDAYSLDPLSGQKTLVVSAGTVGDAMSLVVAEHTVYGMVCLFHKRPWGGRLGRYEGVVSNAVYDQDRDGVLDGEFLGIPYLTRKQHELWTTGEFLYPWSGK